MIAFPEAAPRRSKEAATRRQAAGCPPIELDRLRPGILDGAHEQAWILVPLTLSAAEKAGDRSPVIPASGDSTSTIIDTDLGARILELTKRRAGSPSSAPAPTVVVEPDQTLILDGRPLPPAPRTEPLLPGPGHAVEAEPTEVMFAPRGNAALPPSSHSQASLEDTFVGRDSAVGDRPVLVAHVIAPRRDLALVAAMLAWTIAVASAVYLLASHRAAQLVRSAPSSSAPVRAPEPR